MANSTDPGSSSTRPVSDKNEVNSPPVHAADAADPEKIGPYHIVERIGEGGMGVVYKAEQRDNLRRVVAVKLIRIGMDTREVVARFDAERQALALMSHPGVARVFDAGVSAEGRPYFVMEYVPGVPLNQYCDQEKLTTRQRLTLFTQVCQAVQHAHQKGIIHRDLKPSNILVTLVDGQPVPKVIDFGIAKATSSRLTQQTLITETGRLIGTPEYMSPEQALTSGLDVDTRTDIYALGVILYQLLTGTLPFDSDTLRKVGQDAIANYLRDVEPARPSTRVSEASASADVAQARSILEIARAHKTDPRTLAREIRGDLDWITLKAMEKERARRYETAQGLAVDVQRHLDIEPVLARPPSATYRIGRFVRKHRVSVAAAAMVLLAIIGGAIGTSIGLMQAKRALGRAVTAEGNATTQKNLAIAASEQAKIEKARAQSEAATATAVSNFISRILLSANPEISKAAADTRLVDLLDSTAAACEKELAAQPQTEIQIRGMLASTYANLGLTERSVENFRIAWERATAIYPQDAVAVNTASHYGFGLTQTSKPAEAERVVRPALGLALTKYGPHDRVVQDLRNTLALAAGGLGRWQEAEGIYLQLIAETRAADTPSAKKDRAVYLVNLGHLYEQMGDQAGAQRIDREIEALGSATTAKQLLNQSTRLRSQGKLEEAEKVARTALEEAGSRYGPDHSNTLDAQRTLADLLVLAGRYDEANSNFEAIRDHFSRVPASPDTRYRSTLDCAFCASLTGNDKQAGQFFQQAIDIRRQSAGSAAAGADWRLMVQSMGMHLYDAHRWAGSGLRNNAARILDDFFFGNAGENLSTQDADLSKLHFQLLRWTVAGKYEPVAQGDAAKLLGLPDPAPGLYQLALDIPRGDNKNGSVRGPMLFAPWTAKIISISPNAHSDPSQWSQSLKAEPDEVRQLSSIALDTPWKFRFGPLGRPLWFAIAATSSVELPAGKYRFSIKSNDGARLWVDDRPVIDYWPLKIEREEWPTNSGEIELAPGRHLLRLEYFQAVGGAQLWVTAEPVQ